MDRKWLVHVMIFSPSQKLIYVAYHILLPIPDARILWGILCPIGFYTHVTRRHRQMKTWALEHEYFCLYRIQESKHCIK